MVALNSSVWCGVGRLCREEKRHRCTAGDEKCKGKAKGMVMLPAWQTGFVSAD
jgi:threonine dehydrogenase-like Zn-dependent dehydrogenase